MVLHLAVAILYLLLRFYEVLHQLLHPFSNDPQHSTRFHEENTITDLLLSILRSILRDLSSNQILRKGLDLILVDEIFMS